MRWAGVAAGHAFWRFRVFRRRTRPPDVPQGFYGGGLDGTGVAGGVRPGAVLMKGSVALPTDPAWTGATPLRGSDIRKEA